MAEPTVKHFRLALLWPLRLLPAPGAAGPQQRPWQMLREPGEVSPWREVEHDYEREGSVFLERHYNEFVTFLPYVQQFLYGEGRSRRNGGDDDDVGRGFLKGEDAALELTLAGGVDDVREVVDRCGEKRRRLCGRRRAQRREERDKRDSDDGRDAAACVGRATPVGGGHDVHPSTNRHTRSLASR